MRILASMPAKRQVTPQWPLFAHSGRRLCVASGPTPAHLVVDPIGHEVRF